MILLRVSLNIDPSLLQSGTLAFFSRTLGTNYTLLGGNRMSNARFEHFGGRFEVV